MPPLRVTLKEFKLKFISSTFKPTHSLTRIPVVKNKDIRIGDYVVIRKAGDVIPEVVRTLVERRTGYERLFEMASTCPYCNSPLVRHKDEAAHFCENAHCDGRKVESLIHYAGRDMMNIDGLGEKLVALLFERGFLKYFLIDLQL